jgi:hypothetical protein
VKKAVAMQTLAEERAVERDDLSETFADLLFSVEVTSGNVFVTLGVTRVDHRGKTKIRSEVTAARLVLTHKVTRELVTALAASVEVREKVAGDDERVALTFSWPAH